MRYLEIQGNDRFRDYEWLEINNKRVKIPPPYEIPDIKFVERERENIINIALSVCRQLNGHPPMHFRLTGPPGVGKNCIFYHLAKLLGRDPYIFEGSAKLQSHEIAIWIVPTMDNNFEFVASPLFAAMLKGGILFFDEIEKVPVDVLAELHPVLDDRRILTVPQLGINLKPHKEFLFCAATNSDETFDDGLPKHIDERLRPIIYVGNPSRRAIEEILRAHMTEADEVWFKVFLEEYQNERLTPRTSTQLLECAYRLYDYEKSIGKVRGEIDKRRVKEYLLRAEEVIPIRSKDRFDLAGKKRKKEEDFNEDFLYFTQKRETFH